jgi:tetratricopeptide (TPR) repeat protein
MAIKGWGAPEVERIYVRAQELCEQIGDTPELFRALWGLWQFRTNRAELDVSMALGKRLLTMARLANDSGVVLEAHHALWTCLFLQGDLVAARDEVTEGIALYDADLHGSLASLYGHHDPGVCSRAIGAWLLELLADADNATRYSLDAIALARRLNHPFSEAHALVFATFLHRERGNAHLTLQLAEQAKAIARDRGFALLLSRATAMHGWAMAQAGAVEEGIGQMEAGIAAIRRIGSSFLTYLLACLADGCRKAGRVTEALDIVTEALTRVEATGERFYEAELLRMRGELLLDAGGDDAEAERCLQAAFAIGGRQRALVLQRRAFKSLSDLLDRHGRQDEARRLAAEL